jgi:hypothetical protein
MLSEDVTKVASSFFCAWRKERRAEEQDGYWLSRRLIEQMRGSQEKNLASANLGKSGVDIGRGIGEN